MIGSYDSQVAFGQSRVLLVWTRLILPNGRSIVLERQPGADTAGNAGLEDEVDSHWRELFKAAALSTLLGAATEIGSSGQVTMTSFGPCAAAQGILSIKLVSRSCAAISTFSRR